MKLKMNFEAGYKDIERDTLMAEIN